MHVIKKTILKSKERKMVVFIFCEVSSGPLNDNLIGLDFFHGYCLIKCQFHSNFGPQTNTFGVEAPLGSCINGSVFFLGTARRDSS